MLIHRREFAIASEIFASASEMQVITNAYDEHAPKPLINLLHVIYLLFNI